MNIPKHDVLLVGGGGAGLRAAIAASETYRGADIGVVSKVYPMRSHTVSAEGGTAAVLREDDNLDLHAYDTIKGSDYLGDQDVVEAFVKEAVDEVIQLEHWGCPWSRDEDGRVSVRAFGGMSVKRTLYAADKTGFHMLHALFQTSLKYDAITRYDEWFVTSLLVEDGRVCGVTALNIRSGNIHAIGAKSVIICTGGAGKIFPFTTNASIKNGDGMALAYRIGCPLKDLEFVQYHPHGLARHGHLNDRSLAGRRRPPRQQPGANATSANTCPAKWNSVRATSYLAPLFTNSNRATSSKVPMAATYTSTFGTWEKKSSTKDCPLCANSPAITSALTPFTNPFPCAQSSTTAWGVCIPTSMAQHPSPVFMPQAKRLVSASMAPIAWGPTH